MNPESTPSRSNTHTDAKVKIAKLMLVGGLGVGVLTGCSLHSEHSPIPAAVHNASYAQGSDMIKTAANSIAHSAGANDAFIAQKTDMARSFKVTCDGNADHIYGSVNIEAAKTGGVQAVSLVENKAEHADDIDYSLTLFERENDTWGAKVAYGWSRGEWRYNSGESEEASGVIKQLTVGQLASVLAQAEDEYDTIVYSNGCVLPPEGF